MKKRMRISSSGELASMQRALIQQAEATIGEVMALFKAEPPISALSRLKFEKITTDGIFGEHLDFVEFLNQTLTYLVCLYAGNVLLKRNPMEEVIINFGTAPGHDVSSYSGTVICECFAATSVKSNEKLKKDILRLHGNPTAKERLVFYYSHNADAERSYIEKLANQYKDVALWSIPFDALISEYK